MRPLTILHIDILNLKIFTTQNCGFMEIRYRKKFVDHES